MKDIEDSVGEDDTPTLASKTPDQQRKLAASYDSTGCVHEQMPIVYKGASSQVLKVVRARFPFFRWSCRSCLSSSIVTVANVQHLGTRMEGMLSQPAPSVVELVRALSPTPALGGHPRDAAIELIGRVEGFERGRYGGAVGWVDAAGNGTWAVAIRCAELAPDRRSARLVAGGGIVADSDPRAELAETQAKFQAMLSAIVRP